MSLANSQRSRSSPASHRVAVLLAGGLLATMLVAISTVYCASPYFATDAAVARLANKTLAATITDGELQAMSANLYSALDQVVPGASSDERASVLAQIGRAVVQEVRGQLLTEATRQLASREGIDLALYGWQTISDRRVSVQRDYLDFPRFFSVSLVDAADGTTLTELVFLRNGFSEWSLVAVRPHWMRNQGSVLLRQIVQAGIQKVMQPNRAASNP